MRIFSVSMKKKFVMKKFTLNLLLTVVTGVGTASFKFEP